MTSGRALARDTGAQGEDLACAHLQAAGLRLLKRNVQYRHGELDLIMLEGATVVFVEVRYRRGGGFGDGIDSVTARKRERLTRAAASFLAEQPQLARAACRFDVIAISGSPTQPQFDWRRNAFDAS
ncbi:MAG: YraN family protein [Dokdonella sp.]|uniref:YraN family protein n=1 Tax=Dokdonella sp. TaxID=2291710 RepID=UPI0025BE3D1F|nr:YraN family protein [Dokdonella sp.]MBZ0221864.1 YraN family protein [Dokdonella sp.]MCC7255963.1 YraN family protein [Dokdonella sp.]